MKIQIHFSLERSDLNLKLAVKTQLKLLLILLSIVSNVLQAQGCHRLC